MFQMGNVCVIQDSMKRSLIATISYLHSDGGITNLNNLEEHSVSIAVGIYVWNKKVKGFLHLATSRVFVGQRVQ